MTSISRTSRNATRTASRAARRAASAALAAALALAATAEQTPRVVVERTANAVIEVLNEKEMSSEEKRARIEEIVYANVDFDTLVRLVLARNWKRFDDEQKEAFRREFKKHLSVTYGNNINEYRNESVAILGEREEKRGDWTVHTKVVRAAGAQDFLVDYRLRRRAGQWKIIDVVVEGGEPGRQLPLAVPVDPLERRPRPPARAPARQERARGIPRIVKGSGTCSPPRRPRAASASEPAPSTFRSARIPT